MKRTSTQDHDGFVPPPAATPLDLLCAWAQSTLPPADLALLLPVESREIEPVSVKRTGNHWTRLSLPTVPLPGAPRVARRSNLARERHDTLGDLLFSLGAQHVMIVPLVPARAGAVLLARTEAGYRDDEIPDESRRARSLGRSIAALPRPGDLLVRAASEHHELGALFALMKDLTRAESAAAVAEVAAETLQRLLRPDALAIVATLRATDRPTVHARPPGALGAEASARAMGAMSGNVSESTTWVHVPLAMPSGGMALGWNGRVPENAPRLTAAASALLTLAFGRVLAQRQREEDRLGAVVDGLPMGAILLSAEGLVRLANPAALRLLAQDAESVTQGRRLERIGGTELQTHIDAAVRGESSSFELFLAADGGRHLTLRFGPAQGPGGGADVLVVIEDVTLAKRRASQGARVEKLSALGTLISGVVHEVNNPLSTVLGYGQMLQTSPDSPRRDEWLGTLTEEAQRAQRIVGSLLSFVRPKDSTRVLVSPVTIAEKAMELATYGFRVAQIEATFEADPNTPAIHADGDAVLRLLLNLMTNAMHALEEVSHARRVSVQLSPSEAGGVALVVADNGPGIPPDVQNKIFDPFFTTKEEGRGTGLGLSLALQTMADHGGEITLESAPGRGARFTLTFPPHSFIEPSSTC